MPAANWEPVKELGAAVVQTERNHCAHERSATSPWNAGVTRLHEITLKSEYEEVDPASDDQLRGCPAAGRTTAPRWSRKHVCERAKSRVISGQPRRGHPHAA
jgi:hypothetical protein